MNKLQLFQFAASYTVVETRNHWALQIRNGVNKISREKKRKINVAIYADSHECTATSNHLFFLKFCKMVYKVKDLLQINQVALQCNLAM